MGVQFVVKSWDGTSDGATLFELQRETGEQLVTSFVFPTRDMAVECIRRLVYDCQYTQDYTFDVGADSETWKYHGVFRAYGGGGHWARTAPADTEAEARQLGLEVVEEIRRLSGRIPLFVAPHDGPSEPHKDELPG